MKYITLLRLFKNNFDLDLMFYDVKEDRVIKFKKEVYDFDQNDIYNFSSAQLKKLDYLTECVKNETRYKPIPLPSNDIYVVAKRRFENTSKNYSLVDKLIKAGYEEEGINMFLDLLESPSCSYMVNNIIDEVCREIIQLFILQNSLTMIEDFNPYSLPYTYLKKIYELSPWYSICESDVLRINIDDRSLFVSIIGNENLESLGFYVYTSEENYTTFLAQEKNCTEPSILFNTLMNAYVFDYCPIEERTSEEQIMATKSKVSFKKKAIPAMKRLEEGLVPSSEFDYNELCYISYILRYIYQALVEYYNNASTLDLEVDEYLAFDIFDNEAIKLKTWDNDLPIRVDYGIKPMKEDLSYKLDSNKTYEVSIQPVETYLIENHELYWVYTLVVLDKDVNKIVTIEQYYVGQGLLGPLFQKYIHKFVKNNGFAKKVLVSNSFVKEILDNSIGEDLEIEYSYPSEEMIELFKELNEQLREFESSEDDEAILN